MKSIEHSEQKPIPLDDLSDDRLTAAIALLRQIRDQWREDPEAAFGFGENTAAAPTAAHDLDASGFILLQPTEYGFFAYPWSPSIGKDGNNALPF